MAVQLFKILTGEFVISEVSKESETEITLKNPTLILLQQVPGNDQPQAYFAPFIPFSEAEKVTLKVSSIVAVTAPDEQLEKQYNKMYSPIVIANVLPGA